MAQPYIPRGRVDESTMRQCTAFGPAGRLLEKVEEYRHALVEHLPRLVDVRREDPVGEEAGPVVHDDHLDVVGHIACHQRLDLRPFPPSERLPEIDPFMIAVNLSARQISSPGLVDLVARELAHARERLANFKVPRAVTFTDDLPRNAAGKVPDLIAVRILSMKSRVKERL